MRYIYALCSREKLKFKRLNGVFRMFLLFEILKTMVVNSVCGKNIFFHFII